MVLRNDICEGRSGWSKTQQKEDIKMYEKKSGLGLIKCWDFFFLFVLFSKNEVLLIKENSKFLIHAGAL